MARKRALLNIKIPGTSERLTPKKILAAAVTAGVVIGVWNWSERIPVVGGYIALGKYYIGRALGGNPYAIKPTVTV
jgi:hypothetical protein